MKPSLYLETTIPSYLTARPTRDLIMAAHQQITQEWWEKRLADFRVFISQLVLDECALGDADAARRRMTALKELPLAQIDNAVLELAQALVRAGAVPRTAGADAVHIATAAFHDMDFLLTWNCSHINNAETVAELTAALAQEGYGCPRICTPEELMGK
jgi:predicted nucleic acid-binding protein